MAKHSNPGRGIYLRGSSYWLTHQKDGARVRVPLHTADFAEAARKAVTVRASPLLAESHGIALDVKRFVAWKRQKQKYSKHSCDSKGTVLNAFARWLGGVSTASITTAVMQEYYDHLLAPHDVTREVVVMELDPAKKKTRNMKRKVVVSVTRTVSTANGYMVTFRSFFNWAVKIEKLIRFNPCVGVETVNDGGAARLSFCTPEVRDKLIRNCKNTDLKFALFCGFHAGFRYEEIVEATPFWFDMERKLINLRKTPTMKFKDLEERGLPMTNEFHSFIKKEMGLRTPFMFRPDKKHGKGLYRCYFDGTLARYVKSQGHPEVTSHMMRHTFASLLASVDTSIYQIAEWLGDDVRVVQKHYAKLLPLHNRLERAFSKAGV